MDDLEIQVMSHKPRYMVCAPTTFSIFFEINLWLLWSNNNTDKLIYSKLCNRSPFIWNLIIRIFNYRTLKKITLFRK